MNNFRQQMTLKFSIGTVIQTVLFPYDHIDGIETIEFVKSISINDHYLIKQFCREFPPCSNWSEKSYEMYYLRYENLIRKAIKTSRRHPEEGYVLISAPFGDNLDTRQ